MIERLPRRTLLWCALPVLLAAGACRPSAAARAATTASEPSLSEDVYRGYLRGRMAMIEGDYDAAVHAFRQAARAAPDQAYIVVALIDAVAASGERDEALSLAARARATWPSVPELWMLSGALYRERARERNSNKDLQRAIDMVMAEARALERQGQNDRALEALSRALAWHPGADTRARIQARIRALSARTRQ